MEKRLSTIQGDTERYVNQELFKYAKLVEEFNGLLAARKTARAKAGEITSSLVTEPPDHSAQSQSCERMTFLLTSFSSRTHRATRCRPTTTPKKTKPSRSEGRLAPTWKMVSQPPAKLLSSPIYIGKPSLPVANRYATLAVFAPTSDDMQPSDEEGPRIQRSPSPVGLRERPNGWPRVTNGWLSLKVYGANGLLSLKVSDAEAAKTLAAGVSAVAAE